MTGSGHVPGCSGSKDEEELHENFYVEILAGTPDELDESRQVLINMGDAEMSTGSGQDTSVPPATQTSFAPPPAHVATASTSEKGNSDREVKYILICTL